MAWRSWGTIFEQLPPVDGRLVLDLGCGIGDQAAELVTRGARVIGLDANAELLAVARGRALPRAEFFEGDLRNLPDIGEPADGLWCSFAAAYFPGLSSVLSSWKRVLRPGGWAALTEVDDLFGHQPLDARVSERLEAYAAESLRAGRYDFFMGRKLVEHLRGADFEVARVFEVPDRELSFEGAAPLEVLEAWRRRFDRMRLLRDFCGPAFEQVRDAFLQCLASEGHRASARVTCCIARAR